MATIGLSYAELERRYGACEFEAGLRTALRDLNANLQLGPAIVERCMECGPGD
ncbi:hypothetical protein GCM10007160_23690 [Litchfieldella qijiaojingensis]|uniref:Uncharacterized protein n=1 Tax=Litchfieldella qijiaojingensis TaxID=980347 RepID=A0ABQ2YUT8_9GAMM|nr:hypothetical protein [Halomonas qijiaojingensis]GGX95376.1 hypothetical protein GCM10007160_23690 [Halomonas qijiaojingensis]